jgi:L-alanine-DL-glutamate epimerase-like enolase superfamily enzyme
MGLSGYNRGGITGVQIRAIRFHAVEFPVDPPIEMAHGALRRRALALVEVVGADGTCGLGETWVNFPSWAVTERRATVEEGLAPLVNGRSLLLDHDPGRAIGDLVQRVTAALAPVARQWGAPGPVHQAVCGLEQALWDLAGKRAGRSVADLLGRSRDRVAVYASGLGPHGGGVDVAEQIRSCMSEGFTAAKIRVGIERGTDERTLRTARDAAGDGFELLADANQGWTLDDALSVAPVLRECDVAWVEEPVAGDAIADLEEFHRRTGITVATGENRYGRQAWEEVLRSPAVAVLQPDVSKTTGVGELAELCRLASDAGKAIQPHLYGGAIALAATLQVAAARAGITRVEFDVRANPARDEVVRGPFRREGAVVFVPRGPGLGVVLRDGVPGFDGG